MSRPGNTKPRGDRKPALRARRAPQAAAPAPAPLAAWSVEEDRREEFLALSCLTAVRKAS